MVTTACDERGQGQRADPFGRNRRAEGFLAGMLNRLQVLDDDRLARREEALEDLARERREPLYEHRASLSAEHRDRRVEDLVE
jgi:hypothetical protein